MLSTIKEESKIDDVVFVIGDNTIKCKHNDLENYSCISSIFASQSPIFSKLIKKHKKKHKHRKTNEIHLKHMTDASFCFIRNSFYELQPVLTYTVVVHVLYSSIKYELKALIKQCVAFLMRINNTNDYFSVIRSFSLYPKSLFQSFFVNNFCSKSQFIINNIQQIISNEKLIQYSSLFTMHIFCEYIVSQQLIDHKQCYQVIISWCRYQFNTKFKPLLSIKDDYNKYGEISVNGEFQHAHSDTSTYTVSASNISLISFESDTDAMITKWQDLIQDFIPLIDFRQIDIEYILVDIRSHHIMSHQDLLSILLQKYEYDKRHKPEAIVQDIGTSVTDNTKQEDVFRTKDMYLKREELQSLSIGSQMDVRDTFGRYLKAEIMERNETNRNKMKIHYIGWNKMWDRWIDIGSGSLDHQLIAKYGNITERKIHKIQIQDLGIGDKVIIKLPMYHKHVGKGWVNAEIINIDKGQLNVEYKINHEGDAHNDVHEFWVHADNIDECR